MPRAKPLLIATTAIWLGGCAADAARDPGQGAAPAELLQGIEIDRIGRNRVQLREFQDRAMAEAVAYVVDRGVGRERIELITVETVGGDRRSGMRSRARGGVRRTPVRFTVWLRIADCEASVLFRAGATGRIAEPKDKSGCLSADGEPMS